MIDKLHVVGIQADLFWENSIKNRAYFEDKIKSLPDTIDIVILPEMFTTGFTMNAEKIAEEMNGVTVSWMQKMASKKQIAITGSAVIKEENCYYNRLLFIHPCGKIEKYDKRHSFTLANEDKVYTSGTEKLIVNYKGWKICTLICYDLRFPVWARNKENYDLLIYMANWPVNRIKAWSTLLKARAIENMSYVIGVNRTGKDANDYLYTGNSAIIDYLGDDLANLNDNQIGLVTATLVKSDQDSMRNKLGFLNDSDFFRIHKKTPK